MFRSRAPNKLCYLCLIYVTYTHSLTDHSIYRLDDRNQYEILAGDTPDIYEFVEYEWYAPVWYLETRKFLGDNFELG